MQHRVTPDRPCIGKYAKAACAGPLMAAELDALSKALANPARPLVAIVAGSKSLPLRTSARRLTSRARSTPIENAERQRPIAERVPRARLGPPPCTALQLRVPHLLERERGRAVELVF